MDGARRDACAAGAVCSSRAQGQACTPLMADRWSRHGIVPSLPCHSARESRIYEPVIILDHACTKARVCTMCVGGGRVPCSCTLAAPASAMLCPPLRTRSKGQHRRWHLMPSSWQSQGKVAASVCVKQTTWLVQY